MSSKKQMQDKIKLDKSVLEEMSVRQKSKGIQEEVPTHEPAFKWKKEKGKGKWRKEERKEEGGLLEILGWF